MQPVSYDINEHACTLSATCSGQVYTLPALWLRERCQDPDNLDGVTKQRLFDPHFLDQNITLTEVKKLSDNSVQLSFSDGYSGAYDLREFDADFNPAGVVPEAKAWRSDIDKSLFYIDLAELSTDQGLRKGLETFLTYGVLIIDNVPTESGALIDVGKIFGHVRETNFGMFFEVFSRPNSTDLAYRSVALGPHTDNPYRSPIPGIQLLHCLENHTTQGLSTLADSLAVIEQLRAEDPEGFKLLCSVPVRYRYLDEDIELVERRTMIETDINGNVVGVAYSPRLDYLPLLPEHELIVFHRARKRLGELFCDPQYQWCFRLEPGQLQMFHNNRVLHGRTSFNPNEGRRHLQGAYIDLDGPKGRYKALMRKLGA